MAVGSSGPVSGSRQRRGSSIRSPVVGVAAIIHSSWAAAGSDLAHCRARIASPAAAPDSRCGLGAVLIAGGLAAPTSQRDPAGVTDAERPCGPGSSSCGVAFWSVALARSVSDGQWHPCEAPQGRHSTEKVTEVAGLRRCSAGTCI